MITFKNVSLIRDGNYILNGINWEVKAGEHWAILGLNGSGKTTLLNIINGYLFPSKGEVEVMGATFGQFDLRELRKNIGWVSSSIQERIYKNEIAIDIVLSGKFSTIGLYDETNDEDLMHAINIVEQLGCKDIYMKPYTVLSQGEKQKILIARALFNNPKLLILDEPCTGLDIISREQLLNTIDGLSKDEKGPTLLYVTHRVEEISASFSKILLIKNGEVHSMGNKDGLLTNNNLTSFFNRRVEVLEQNNHRLLRFIG